MDAARRVLRVTAAAIDAAAERLPDGMEAAVEAILATHGRLIFSGLGKSGIICRKLAATFSSTGTPAYFVHSADALHGDLGMIDRADTVIAVSHSGGTEELLRLIEHTKRHGATIIVISGNADGPMTRHADVAVCYRLVAEGGPLDLAPMASTSMALAIGDALAAEVMARTGFSAEQFAHVHPGGGLGRRLLTVADILDAIPARQTPSVRAAASLVDCLHEMSDKRLGMTTVHEGERIGVMSDGDVRRCLEEQGAAALDATAADLCTWVPQWIDADEVASKALGLMEERRITALLVRGADGNLAGVVHLHDLWGLQMV